MPEKKDITPDKNTVPAGEIPSPPHDDLDFPETDIADTSKRLATGTAENALNAATPGGSPAEPGAPDIWGSDPDEEVLSEEEWEGLLVDEDPTEFPHSSAQKPIADVFEVADDQSDQTSGQKDANTPPPIPSHTAEQHPDTTAPSTNTQTTGAQPEPQGSDDFEDWDSKSTRWGGSNGKIRETNPVETHFFTDKGRTTAAHAAKEAAEDQRVIDQAAREAAAELPDYDPMKHIRLRTWLGVAALVAAVAGSSFWAGREVEKLNGQPEKPQSRELLRNDQGQGGEPSAEEELGKARAKIEGLKEDLRGTKKANDDMQKRLLEKNPLEISIPGISLREGKRGRYCPIDTFELNAQLETEGYRLIDIRKEGKPSYLFLKQIGDLTHYVRVFIRQTNPKVQWSEFQPGQRAAVKAVEWFEEEKGEEQ